MHLLLHLYFHCCTLLHMVDEVELGELQVRLRLYGL